jgi:hypothetical protein
MRLLPARVCALTLALGLAAGCIEDHPAPSAPVLHAQQPPPPQTFPASGGGQLDLLFVIDNSPSMGPMQAELMQSLGNLVAPLEALAVPPDLHVGIVSSDLGAGRFQYVPGCRVGGDQGFLQNTPRHPTKCGSGTGQGQLLTVSDRFLTLAPDPAGGPPKANFTGTLSDAFACYAALGDQGCGFEYQLASAQAALTPCSPAGLSPACPGGPNDGFLRQDAYLAVIVLSNEDDASAPADTNLWDPSEDSVTSVLGPLTSYRQFEFGVVCDGLPPGRSPGPRTGCVAGSWDPDLTHREIPPADLAAFFRGLKPDDPRMVYVAVITGPPEPVVVAQMEVNGYPTLAPSCIGGATGAQWTAVPGIRFAEFVGAFDGDRGRFIDPCASALGQPLQQVGDELAGTLGVACITPPLRDLDPATDGLQLDCLVRERSVDVVDIPPCDPEICDPATAPGGDCRCQQHALPASGLGCWYVWKDPDHCATLPVWKPADAAVRIGGGYRFKVDRGTDASCTEPPAPAGAELLVDCTRCAADPARDLYDCSPGCAPNWPACCPTASPGCWQ